MEHSRPPYGDDLFPALRKLLGFLEPYVMPVLLATIALTLPYILSDLRASANPQVVVPLQAFQIILSRVGTYLKVGFLVSLACYMPIYYGVPLPFQPWLQGLILIVVVVVGFFAPTAKFVGPARFGYLQHSTHLSSIYRLLLDWWVYVALFLVFSPAILPSAGLGLISMLVAAWVHVYLEYVKQRNDVANAVTQHATTAALAAAAAQEDAAAAGRYEAELAAAAVAARRDALQTLTVRSTDFFDKANDAWTAMATVAQPVEQAAERAQNLIDAANDAAGAEKPDEEKGHTELLGQYLAESAQLSLKEANSVAEKLRTAQDAVSRSENAAEQHKKAREAAEKLAELSSKAVRELAETVKKWPGMAHSVATHAAKAQAFADQALTAATDGEMEKAWELATSSQKSATDAETGMEKLRSEVSNGQLPLITWLECKE
ncbi:hypothetical protein F5Y04DRAFT_80296 [Hypomontagnella monticulosa]|nr:hypothetical protein F5Y04DRAFT_80296 [Hypomontagnella monticulosa]